MANHEKSEEQIKRDLEALELSIKKRYEQRDINIPKVSKAITGFFVGSGVLVVIATIAMFIIYKQVNGISRSPMEPGPNQADYVRPPLAPLQSGTEAKKDIADLRHQEEAKTDVYAQRDGRNQIPVDRAIDILAERGLEQAPAQPAGMPAAERPVETGTPTETPSAPVTQ